MEPTVWKVSKVPFWWKKLSQPAEEPCAYLRVTAGFATCRVRYMFATGMQIRYVLHSTNFVMKVSKRVVNIFTIF